MIVWPFLSLMIAILVIRVMRGFRHAGELQSQRIPLAVPESHRKPSDDFHDRTWLPLCQNVAEAAGGKLNRALTPVERRTIWCSRAPLILEVLLKDIQAASSADGVASLLASLPSGMDRPDPTGWRDITSVD